MGPWPEPCPTFPGVYWIKGSVLLWFVVLEVHFNVPVIFQNAEA